MFLSRLEVQLRTQLSADPGSDDGRARLAEEAHKLVSAAGMFGFLALSDSCSRLEAAAADNQGDLATVLDDTRAACAEALAEIRLRLQSDGGQESSLKVDQDNRKTPQMTFRSRLLKSNR